MLNNVYVVYNNLTLRYGDVLAFPSDKYAIKRVLSNIDKVNLEETIQEIELCRIGTINIESGELIAHSPIRIGWEAPKNIDELAN